MRATLRTLLMAGALAAMLPITPARAQPAAPMPQGQVLVPAPDPAFGGAIERTFQESRPGFPAAVQAPRGTPNVLLIMLDDVGYGPFGTFGGLIPTPALDQLAQQGLRYTRTHNAVLCSPMRDSEKDRDQ